MEGILLVEDNDMNRDMLSRRLQRRGHEIIIATVGEEARPRGFQRSVEEAQIHPK